MNELVTTPAYHPKNATSFVRPPAPGYLMMLFYAFLAFTAGLVVWRTAVVDWGVWFAPLAWLGDLFGLATSALFLIVARQRAIPVRPAAVVHRTVDILVPTLNEPLAVLEPAVLGATRVRGVRRVLVLDDGGRAEVAQMARRLGAEYLSRGTGADAKAGNLNHALAFTDAELVAVFDADHVPLPEFLEQTVGYFNDLRVGFVQTPQTFYNTESLTFRRPWRRRAAGWHEQQMFYHFVQPAKNATNSAMFTGTGAVLRRTALERVGGFATGTATEDIHTSLRLHANGWRSVFVPRPLAYGLEVDNLREYYRTRRRWAAGSLGLLLRSPDSPLRVRGLTIVQRLSYLSSTLAHLHGPQRLTYLLVPVLAVATLDNPVRVPFAAYGLVLVGFAALSLWLTHRLAAGAYRPWYAETLQLATVLPPLAGLRGIMRVERKFRVSTKNAGRSSGRGLKLMYAGLAAIGVAGLVRVVQLLLTGEASGLVVWSGAFLAVTTILLGHLLVWVVRYERRPVAPAHARLAPAALYQYVLFRFGTDRQATSAAARNPASADLGRVADSIDRVGYRGDTL